MNDPMNNITNNNYPMPNFSNTGYPKQDSSNTGCPMQAPQDPGKQGNPKLRPWQGVLVQAGFLVLFLTLGAWMQKNWGRIGLATTELMFLVASVIYCLARRVKLKEMFPVKKIHVADFFGTMLMGAAGFLFSLVALGISLLVLPDSTREVATGLNEFLYGGGAGYPILVLLVAFLPGLCEESMERGAVLSHFRSIKKDWVVVLIMGVFFGIMHMSALRFLSTATLGAVLSYIVIKKNNILLSMMLHFTHNFVTLTMSYVASSALPQGTNVDVSSINGATALGVYLIMGFAAPVLLVCGMMLLDREHHKASRFAIAGGVSAVMLFAGVGLMATSVIRNFQAPSRPIVDSEIAFAVVEEGVPEDMTFDVTEEKTYAISVEIKNIKGEYTFVLQKKSGEELLRVTEKPDSNGEIHIERTMDLSKDSYLTQIIPDKNSKGDSLKMRVTVKAASAVSR